MLGQVVRDRQSYLKMHIIALFTVFFLAADTTSVPGNVPAADVSKYMAAFTPRGPSKLTGVEGQGKERPKKLKNKKRIPTTTISHEQTSKVTTSSADPSSDKEGHPGDRPVLGRFVTSSSVKTLTAQQHDSNTSEDSSSLAASPPAKQPDSPLGKGSSASSMKKPVTRKIIVGIMLLLICAILGIGIKFVSSSPNVIPWLNNSDNTRDSSLET